MSLVSASIQTLQATPRQVGQTKTLLDEALDAAERATTVEELIKEAGSAPAYNTPYVREGLWYSAAFVTRSEQFSEKVLLAKRVIKFAVFATLLELAARQQLAKWPKDEDLLSLGPNSLLALQNRLTFAREGNPILGEGDPITPLLKRRPAIDSSSIDGHYRSLQLNHYVKGVVWLFESCDAPWLDLNSQWKKSESTLRMETRKRAVAIEGLFFSFPLASLRFVITAAKMYLCLSLLPPDLAPEKYALLIAGNAFYFASRASGTVENYTLAGTSSDILRAALEKFREQSPTDGQLLTAEKLAPTLTAAQFFARKFESALKSYEAAANSLNRPPDFHIYGEWGAAMCRLAMGEHAAAADHFLRVASLLQEDAIALKDSPYRYMLVALIDAAGAKAIFGDSPQIQRLSVTIESSRRVAISERTRYRLNLDLLHVLYTVGSYDTAARFLMREINRIQQEPDPSFRTIELFYLRELGATMNDVYSKISWVLNKSGNPEPRLSDKQAWSRGFVPTMLDKYLAGCFETSRYGTCSPEEDRATMAQAYLQDFVNLEDESASSVSSTILQLVASGILDAKTLNSTAPKPGSSLKELVDWVEQESKKSPANIDPLLKLIWIEWFYVPMFSLSATDLSISSWRYEPLNRSGLLSVPKLEPRLKSVNSEDAARVDRIWTLFEDVHQFLLKYQ